MQPDSSNTRRTVSHADVAQRYAQARQYDAKRLHRFERLMRAVLCLHKRMFSARCEGRKRDERGRRDARGRAGWASLPKIGRRSHAVRRGGDAPAECCARHPGPLQRAADLDRAGDEPLHALGELSGNPSLTDVLLSISSILTARSTKSGPALKTIVFWKIFKGSWNLERVCGAYAGDSGFNDSPEIITAIARLAAGQTVAVL